MYRYVAQIKAAEKKISIQGLNNFNLNYKLETSNKPDFSDNDIDKIIKYITEEEPYHSMKTKLLNLEKHPIDNIKINQWVDEQPNNAFKIAATKFANSVIYTNYDTIISNVEQIAESLIDEYENTVFLIGNSSHKSNYYFSLLIAAYIYSNYNKLPLKFSKNFIAAFLQFEFNAIYIDIDDMMYTGSQTLDLLLRYTDALKWSFEIEEKNNNLNKTINLLLKHEYLKFKGLRYKLVRLYTSTYAMKEVIKNKSILLPFEIITDKALIPTFKESIVEQNNEDSIINYLIIAMFLNLDYPSITCSYFDYKIADLASTTAFPLLCGYIPSSNFLNYFLNGLIEEFKKRIKSVSSSKFKFINFIDNCEPNHNFTTNFNEIEFHKNYGIFQEQKNSEFVDSLINNCPRPFYKQMRLFGQIKN